MNIRVEDLADKMVKARRVRDEFKRMSLNRQISVKSNSQTRESFFKKKAELTQKEVDEHESRIKEMEKKEAELLEKIKHT